MTIGDAETPQSSPKASPTTTPSKKPPQKRRASRPSFSAPLKRKGATTKREDDSAGLSPPSEFSWKKIRESESLSDEEIFLRRFDMETKYGPSVGISRMGRWERAQRLQLEPPPEVREALLKRGGCDISVADKRLACLQGNC
eukprot:Polyplicarium_translucidae@DN3143_c0_g1_i2.p2